MNIRFIYLFLFLTLGLIIPSVAAITIFGICTDITAMVEQGSADRTTWLRVMLVSAMALAVAYGWAVFTTHYFCKVMGIKNDSD